jgi:hypothetical protein
MRASFRPVLLVAVAVAVMPVACKRRPPAPAPAVSAAPTPAPPATPPAAPEYAVDPAARAVPHREGMRRCPVTADGAYTIIRDVEGGVEIDVVGKNDAAVAEIRARAVRLLSEATSPGAPRAGSAGPRPAAPKSARATPREGSGRSGSCPIMALDAVVHAEPLEHGSRFTVSAESPADVEWLRAQTRALFGKLQAGG